MANASGENHSRIVPTQQIVSNIAPDVTVMAFAHMCYLD